jgi:hypothetical protein
LAILGCSSSEFETAKVAGIVTLDGKPLSQGSVIFHPQQGWPGRGELDSEGRFVLSTYGDKDGAIVGRHSVTVISQTGENDSEHFERPPTRPIRSLIPPRYADKTTSGLEIDVKSGSPNEVELALTSDPAGD